MKKGHIFLILFISVGIIHSLYKDNQLQKNHHVTCGKVSAIWFASASHHITYSFYVNNKVLSGVDLIGISAFNTNISSYIMKDFPVVYHKNDPEYSRIILNRGMMSTYNVSIADWCKCTDTTWLKSWDRFYGDNPPW